MSLVDVAVDGWMENRSEAKTMPGVQTFGAWAAFSMRCAPGAIDWISKIIEFSPKASALPCLMATGYQIAFGNQTWQWNIP